MTRLIDSAFPITLIICGLSFVIWSSKERSCVELLGGHGRSDKECYGLSNTRQSAMIELNKVAGPDGQAIQLQISIM